MNKYTLILFTLLFGLKALVFGSPIKIPRQKPPMNECSYDGKPTSFWRQELLKPNVTSWSPRLDLIFRANPDPKAIPVLLDLVRDQEKDVRWLAINCLSFLGSEGKPAVPALVASLKDHCVQVRMAAAEALEAIGPVGNEAAPALKGSLQDPDARVQLRAARAIWVLTGEVEVIVAILVQLLEPESHSESHKITACEAAETLGQIGPRAEKAVPTLIEVLNKRDAFSSEIRAAIAKTLSQIGPTAKCAVPALQAALKDEHMYTRIRVADALWKVSQQADMVIPIYVEALKEKDHAAHVRILIMRGLSELGPKAKVAIPILIDTTKDPDREIQSAAHEAIKKIDPDLPVQIR